VAAGTLTRQRLSATQSEATVNLSGVNLIHCKTRPAVDPVNFALFNQLLQPEPQRRLLDRQ
jgi:hypothetical protein